MAVAVTHSLTAKYKWRPTNITRTLGCMLASLGLSAKWHVGVELATPRVIKRLNAEYRGKNKVTDILSFPSHHYAAADVVTGIKLNDPQPLGQLFLCFDHVRRRQRLLTGRAVDRHIERLLAHGVAHLLGHDHMTHSQHRAMYPVEQSLIKSIRSRGLISHNIQSSNYIRNVPF